MPSLQNAAMLSARKKLCGLMNGSSSSVVTNSSPSMVDAVLYTASVAKEKAQTSPNRLKGATAMGATARERAERDQRAGGGGRMFVRHL